MLSGVLIFNQKGENLILRAYRTDCRPRLADVFRIQVISNPQVRSPVLTLGSTTFSHVKHENIYLVAITKSNANAALVFEFLYRLIGLGKAYFGKFDEEAVKNNFVLIYELLDEILDFGYPQNTETETLKMYITTEGVKTERAMEDSSKITMQATGALSWRRADIKYRKNEAFVDVIEDVNLLMSAAGTVLRADVNGQIIMRAYLSGMPECKFGLNDRLTLGEDNLTIPSGNKAGTKATKAAAGSVTLEDCQFHQCVKLGRFDTDRTISFVPPDGEFELMRYRATENVNLPFKVHAIVNELGKTKVEYSIAIRANYGNKLFATNVVVRIPTPLNTARITERTSQGKAKYEPEHNNIVWKIPRFTGQSEYVLSAEATLTSMTNQKAWSRPPLSLSFSLLMFTSSGLLVRYLKVFEKGNYSSVKWVRYMTRAGNYEIRCDDFPFSTKVELLTLLLQILRHIISYLVTQEMASLRQSRFEALPDASVISLDANSLKFPNGNILVILDPSDEEGYWLQLHQAVLESKSGKIAELLSTQTTTLLPADLPLPGSHKISSTVKRILTLQNNGDPGELPTLTCYSAAATSPPAVVISVDEDDVADEQTGKRAMRDTRPIVPRFRDTFKSLFAAFYDEQLNISRSDITLALKQSEDLIEIAQTLDAISAIRAQINNALQECRQKLYIAIRADPPRWLSLSLTLESRTIFSESVIHIVAYWPDWLWGTPRQTLAPDLVKLIDRKAKALKVHCWELDRTLLVNTINFDEGDELRSVT
ncbi:MAG: hypothetical protein Q9165_005405 [Trypethelium subeluteriae]